MCDNNFYASGSSSSPASGKFREIFHVGASDCLPTFCTWARKFTLYIDRKKKVINVTTIVVIFSADYIFL